MNNNLFPELPADHPLNTGVGLISVHSPEVLTKPSMFIDLPYQHDKNDRCGRTCRNCTSAFCEGKGKVGCYLHDEKPARNPRARALRCRLFEHWNYAFDNIMADTLRKS